MAAGTLKDPVHSILVDTHNSGGGADTVAFGETSHDSLNHLFIQVEAEEHRVTTLRESALTGSAPEQFGFVFTIDVIAYDIALSLLSVIFAFLVGTVTLRYLHGYPSDYVRLS